MSEVETLITQYLLEWAHHPYLFSTGVIFILFASSFGLPLPEEVVLVTSGIVAHLAMTESQLTGQPPTINLWALAAVCFFAVLMSDLLVFSLGRRYGVAQLKKWPFSRLMSAPALSKAEAWTQKYGALACVAFRFTPGVRFPGHFLCGAFKISYRKFLATDGVAALLSVPTQVILLAYYGDEILAVIKQFKLILLVCALGGAIVWISYKLKSRYLRPSRTT